MPPKSKKGGKPAQQPKQVATTSMVVAPAARRAKKPFWRKRGPPQQLSAGDSVLEKSELLGTVAVPAGKSKANDKLSLQCPDLPFLSKLSACYERVKWLSAAVTYRPGCSMTQAGLITMGMDWNWSATATERKNIACYSPNVSSAVWKESSFTLPSSRLQSRLYYSTEAKDSADAGPGILVWAVDSVGGNSGVTCGEIWIRYKVLLSGTKA